MISGIHAVGACRFRRFPFSGGRHRLVMAVVAAIVFAVHLLSMHRGHYSDAERGVAELVGGPAGETVAGPVASSVADVIGNDPGPVQHGRDGASSVEAGIAGGADVVEIDHPHDEVECGEATQSRIGPAVSALIPAVGCLWVVPRLGGLIRSQGPADLPRWTPHLVRELGVQRV